MQISYKVVLYKKACIICGKKISKFKNIWRTTYIITSYNLLSKYCQQFHLFAYFICLFYLLILFPFYEMKSHDLWKKWLLKHYNFDSLKIM